MLRSSRIGQRLSFPQFIRGRNLKHDKPDRRRRLWSATNSVVERLETRVLLSTQYSVQVLPVLGTVGVSFTAPLAQITTSDTSLTASDFTGGVDFDDGNGLQSLTFVSISSGIFQADVTYTPEGDYYSSDLAVYFSLGTVQQSYQYNCPPVYTGAESGDIIQANANTLTAQMGNAAQISFGDFVDPNNMSASDPGQYTATIDWGDGFESPATLTPVGSVFFVSGSHTWTGSAVYNPTLSITGDSGSWSATVTVLSEKPLVAFPVTPVEGTSFTAPIATFTDPDPAVDADSFTATVNWGNGTSSAATVSEGDTGMFTVTGSYAYATAGVYFADVYVEGPSYAAAAGFYAGVNADSFAGTEVDDAGPDQGINGWGTSLTVATYTGATESYNASVNWGDGDETTASVTSYGSGEYSITATDPSAAYDTPGGYLANVVLADGSGTVESGYFEFFVQPLNIDLVPIYTLPDVDVSGPIAQFSINDPNIDVGDISISASFGGSISIVSVGPGVWDADFSHSALGGGYGIYMGDTIDYFLAVGDGQAYYGSPSFPLYETALGYPDSLSGLTATTTVGADQPVTVADFTDPDNSSDDTVYRSEVDWADGTASWDGNFATDGSGGFLVTDSHVYSAEGTYSAQVIVAGDLGVWIGTATIDVGAPPDMTVTAASISVTDAETYSGTIATFDTDASGAEADQFTAIVDWGDSSDPGTATVVADGGGFDIIASHAYSLGGIFNPSIEIDYYGGDVADAAATATVTDSHLTVTSDAVAVTSGDTFSGTVATFTDSHDPSTANVTASINWEDGSDPVTGTIVHVSGDEYAVVGSYSASSTGNMSPEVTVSDTSGSAEVANPAFVANIMVESAVEGQSVTLDFSSQGQDSDDISYWVVDWGDGSGATTYSGSDTSETYTYSDDSLSPIT
jgi:hypothetical protein